MWKVQPKVLGDLQHSGAVYLCLGAWSLGECMIRRVVH
jgi:hypothetical protein